MAAKKTKMTEVQVPKIVLKGMEVVIRGTAPLITHAWDFKAMYQMLQKQLQLPKLAREAKNPWMDFCNSLYWMEPTKPKNPTIDDVKNAIFGFPAVAFKAAAVSAANNAELTKVGVRSAFHIQCDLVPIRGGMTFLEEDKGPVQRRDITRIGIDTPDIRFRAEFPEWEVTLPIAINPSILAAEQLIQLFDHAGFGTGVGEWRPAKSGSFGTFEVASWKYLDAVPVRDRKIYTKKSDLERFPYGPDAREHMIKKAKEELEEL